MQSAEGIFEGIAAISVTASLWTQRVGASMILMSTQNQLRIINDVLTASLWIQRASTILMSTQNQRRIINDVLTASLWIQRASTILMST